MVIAGHKMDILGKLPLKEYDILLKVGEPEKVKIIITQSNYGI